MAYAPFTGPGYDMPIMFGSQLYTAGWSEEAARDFISTGQVSTAAQILAGVAGAATTAVVGAMMGQGGRRNGSPASIPTAETAPPGTSVVFPGTGMPTQYFGQYRPKGYWNKQGRWIARKRPSMNMLNPSALRRAMRRVEGFAGFAKRTITFTKKVRMKKKGRK